MAQRFGRLAQTAPLAVVFSLAAGSVVRAQAPAPSAPAAPSGAPTNTQPSAVTDLPSGPIQEADLIVILVIGEPGLSGEFRVEIDGTVNLPLAGQIKLANLMPAEAANKIAQTLKNKKLLKDPQVTLNISSRPLKTVFLSGAISSQGRMGIKKDTTLKELLEPAGVLPTSDLQRVIITREGLDKKPQEITVNYFRYRSGESGGANDPVNNPLLLDGDKIFIYTKVVTEGVVKIFGEVGAPQQVGLNKGTTVGQLIQQSGGVTNYADRKGIFITRGAERIPVPYEEILKKTPGTDIALQDKDEVNVPRLDKPKEYTVTGAVNGAGPFSILTKVTLLEAVGQARGTLDGARTKEIEIRRPSDNAVNTRKYNLNDSKDAAVAIEPGDHVYVPYARNRPRVDIFAVLGAVTGLAYLRDVFK